MKRGEFINKMILAGGGLNFINSSGYCVKSLSYFNVVNNRCPSFIGISKDHPFYFESINGEPYIPIGANICFANDMSMDTMVLFMQKLAGNGGNFMRLWLSHPLFEFQTADGTSLNEQGFANIDTIFNLAEKLKVKLKLCIHHFRYITSTLQDPEVLKPFYPQLSFGNISLHKSNGGPFSNMDEYINSDAGRRMYQDRVKLLMSRYGNDPVVFGWELWNEMSALHCEKMSDIIEWNKYMLKEVHKLFPKHLVMQSMQSFDEEKAGELFYRPIASLAENDVTQVHRYLDPGAALAVCKGPMDVIAGDAVDEMLKYHLQKPILLAETGAVESHHVGPSKLHDLDKEGTLLHDYIFAPFFSGAAGPGHSWHWDFYIDKNNLWYHFNRFSECIKGINPVKEKFIPKKIQHPQLRIYVLSGKNTIFIWCRDVESNWNYELVEKQKPKMMNGLSFDISCLTNKNEINSVNFYDPWMNKWITSGNDALIKLPSFERSIVVKIIAKNYFKN